MSQSRIAVRSSLIVNAGRILVPVLIRLADIVDCGDLDTDRGEVREMGTVKY